MRLVFHPLNIARNSLHTPLSICAQTLTSGHWSCHAASTYSVRRYASPSKEQRDDTPTPSEPAGRQRSVRSCTWYDANEITGSTGSIFGFLQASLPLCSKIRETRDSHYRYRYIHACRGARPFRGMMYTRAHVQERCGSVKNDGHKGRYHGVSIALGLSKKTRNEKMPKDLRNML